MYISLPIQRETEIKSLEDLPKLRKRMEALNIKPNYSEIARGFNKDRRTVEKY